MLICGAARALCPRTAIETVACGRHAAEGCDTRRKTLLIPRRQRKAVYFNAINVSAAPYLAHQCATDMDLSAQWQSSCRAANNRLW